VDATVFFAVLAAAALHASWNAVVRVNRDRFLAVALISLGSGFAGLVLLPFVPVPAPAAWPWLIASVLVHTAYKLSLAEAYRTGDLGQIYPLARGTAPLLVACFGFVALNEALAPTAVAGLVVLVLGIWLMALRGGRAVAAPDARSVAYALVTHRDAHRALHRARRARCPQRRDRQQLCDLAVRLRRRADAANPAAAPRDGLADRRGAGLEERGAGRRPCCWPPTGPRSGR